MKRLVFISEMHQLPKLLCYSGKGTIVVALRHEVSDALSASGVEFKSLDDYTKPVEEDALRWMKDWPEMRLAGKTFIESLLHDDLSIWWLMENWLYSSSVYFDSLRDVMLSLQTVENIIKDERPDEMVFVDDGKIFSGILKLFTECHARAVPMRMFRMLYTAKRGLQVAMIRLLINFGFIARRLVWTATKPFHRSTAGKILLISTYAWGLSRDKTGRYTQYDPFIDPLITELGSGTVTVNIPVGKLLGLGQILRKSSTPSYKILENYYNEYAEKNCRASVNSIRKTWDVVRRDSSFIRSFVYRSRNIWPLVRRQFSAYFSCRLEGHIRDAELIKSMLETEKPGVVVYPGETSEFGRTLFHYCNSVGIPSVGIQHGAFSNYVLCLHKKGESRIGEASPNNCPIPTKTLVYGPKYTKMLYGWNYPPGSVAVAGSQRFDRIVNGRTAFSKPAFCRDVGLCENEKIIAFVTSPVPDGDAETMTSAVVDAAEKSHAQLVIKLHPSESPDIYKRAVRSTKSSTIIVRDVDLYEVLNACDVVVTHLSTAALESMIFDKPVIMLNLTGKPDRVDYARKGAAFGVYKKRDLLPVMQKLLLSRDFYARKRRLVKAYVFDNAYMADGKASRRMAKIIRALAEGKRR